MCQIGRGFKKNGEFPRKNREIRRRDRQHSLWTNLNPARFAQPFIRLGIVNE